MADEGDVEEEQLEGLLKQCRLDQLLIKEKELARDVGTIDIELRNVVYDSYSNFIAASDVVKNLKGALENVDETLQSLDSLVSRVVSQSETIDSKLNEQQEVIFQMNQSRSLLQKLTSLLRVPKTIKVALERGAYEVAADIYLDTKPVLDKYSDQHAALREIRDEVDIYRSQAAEALRAKLLQSSEETPHADLVILLARLGEPTVSLVSIYLSSQMKKIKAEIGNIDSAFGTLESMHQIVDSIVPVLERLYSTILCGTVRLSEELFDDTSKQDVVVFVSTSIQATLERIQMGILARCQQTLAHIGGFDTSGLELDQTLSTVEFLNKEDVLEIECIYKILDALRYRSLELDRCIPEARPLHDVQQTVQTILETHIKLAFALVSGRVFRSIKEIIMKIVLNTTAEDDPNSYRFLKVHMKSVDVGFRQDFGIIRSCAMTWILQEWMQKEWIDVVLQCILDSSKGIMLHLASRMGAIAGVESSYPILVPGFIERQFSIPENLKNTCITSLFLSSQIREIQACLEARAADLYKGIHLVSAGGKESTSPVRSFIPQTREAGEIADTLLEQYVQSRKNQLFRPLRDSLRETITHANTPPREPSQAAIQIILTITNIDADFRNTGLPENDSEDSEDISVKHETIWSVLDMCIQEERSIIQSAKISKYAFQQIQIDSHVVKSRLSTYVDDTRRLASLFDTLPITAAEYSDDPILLDPIALDRALSLSM